MGFFTKLKTCWNIIFSSGNKKTKFTLFRRVIFPCSYVFIVKICVVVVVDWVFEWRFLFYF